RISVVFIFVGRFLPLELPGIHIVSELHNGHSRNDGLKRIAISHVDLDPAASLARMLLECRHETTSAKTYSRQIQFSERVSVGVRIDIRRAVQLERFCSPPPLGHLRAFEMNCS